MDERKMKYHQGADTAGEDATIRESVCQLWTRLAGLSAEVYAIEASITGTSPCKEGGAKPGPSSLQDDIGMCIGIAIEIGQRVATIAKRLG